MAIVNFDAGQIFAGKPSGKTIAGWDVPQEYTPTKNPNYMFPIWSSDIVIWLLHSHEPLYLFGPTGCGKSSCLSQIVAKLNYPVYEVTGHNRLEFPEMVGHHTVQQGSMHFEYGPLAKAMKTGGLFLINEIDLLDPATAAGLNSVLDGYPLSIPENGGELIKPHSMFRIAATANSNGAGDDTGLYQGILRQNIAFMDRFIVVQASYLDPAVEKEVLRRVAPTLPETTVDNMIKYANAVRNLFVGETAEGMDTSIEVTFSTRTLIRWALLTVHSEPLKHRGVDIIAHSLDRALVFRASGATKQTLRELLQRLF